MTGHGSESVEEQVDVLVIGAGPAGLAAARALAQSGVRDVVVVDRESRAGGVPRHCHHNGFGLRDLHRAMTGPRYADELVKRTLAAGVRIETETMATLWSEPGVVSLTSPTGVRLASAAAIVLATGARERPRSARLISGDRADGAFTTGQLQQWTYLHHLPVGNHAIVVGAEHVSYSAVLTLRTAGVQTVAMITDLPRHQTYAGFSAAMRWGLRVPLWSDTEIIDIRGHGRIREVAVRNVVSGARRSLEVDTVVFTGDWTPDNELARSAGLALDKASKGPVVDATGEGTVEGLYAAGNLVHPGETADVAARRGAAVGTALARRLSEGAASAPAGGVDIVVEAPLVWSAPGRVVAGRPTDLPYGLILHSAEFRRRPTVIITQGRRPLAHFNLRAAVPNRSLRVPLTWSALVDPDGGEIRVSLA